MKIKSILAASILVLNFACAVSKFTQTGPTYPKHTGPVKVFNQRPEKDKYVEIGIISAQGGPIHQWASLIASLQKKAAKMGANAIVIENQGETNVTMVSFNQTAGLMGSTTPQKNMIAIAIRINEND